MEDWEEPSMFHMKAIGDNERYKIIYDRNPNVLGLVVSYYLRNGWKLHGGPYYDKDEYGHCQAVTRD